MSKENNKEKHKQDDDLELPEVEQELSKVASNPKQNMLILGGMIVVFAYLFFSFFISTDDKKTDFTPMPNDVTKPAIVSADADIPSIPTLPSPPKLEDPTPPPPPVAAPDLAETPPADIGTDPALPDGASSDLLPPGDPSLPFNPALSRGNEANKRTEAKRKSAIMLISGKAPAKTAEQLEQEADFKYRGNMNLLLGRGKMIDAIIESAINSDFGGEIRGIISRDVYSEWGKNILIPKGSRVFGSYTAGISGAIGRVAIEWSRIDLITGYSINLNGTGTDNLGRKGLQGRVDNKFKERFGNAILQSAFNITLANAIDKIVVPIDNSQEAAVQTTAASSAANAANVIFAQSGVSSAQKFAQICATVPNSITDKTSTLFTSINSACTTIPAQQASDDEKLASLMSIITSTSNTAAQESSTAIEPSKAQAAAEQAFTDITDVAKELLERQNLEPTVTLDQGTRIKIYVNKDYNFPKKALRRVTK